MVGTAATDPMLGMSCPHLAVVPAFLRNSDRPLGLLRSMLG
jgi:hypothetical protein